MANTIQITDLTKDIDLTYASGSQEAYKLYYGAQMEALETSVMEHIPDYGHSRPIRATDPDRTFYFTMNVTQDSVDEDEIANNIITLKRWVDGADQQALRYQLTGDCDPIYVKVQLNNWTNATLHEVKWGWVDDSRSYYTQYKDMVTGETIAYQVHVMLRLQPYGEAEYDINLRNDLASSPHFIEDSNSDGLADGWTENGTPTTSIDTDIWLIGGQSQKVVTDSSGEGIYSDTVSNASSTRVIGYMWIYVLYGTVNAVLWDVTASGALLTVAATEANADKTATGIGDVPWVRIPFTVTVPSGNDVRLYVESSTTTAVYYVDGCFKAGVTDRDNTNRT